MARPKDPFARSALIAAARKEFLRAGILRTRIEDITQACGLSKGAFYLHFESKEALFRELVQQLETQIHQVRSAREQAWAGLLGRGLQGRADPAPFVAEALQLEGEGDRALLELFWEWRDVTDVLLRGSQGTEFENVLWTVLDREVLRLERQCAEMKQAGLLRDDVQFEVVGSMIVGTWLLVARRMSTLPRRPDFEPWVRSLQTVIADGASSGSLRTHRDAAAQRAAHPVAPLPGLRVAPLSAASLPGLPRRVRRTTPSPAPANRRRP